MKKILSIIFLTFLLNSHSYGDEKPKFAPTSLNSNIIDFGWIVDDKRSSTEMDIYTLYKISERKEWLLVCRVDYSKSIIFTNCSII
jgi:hypothetical protein